MTCGHKKCHQTSYYGAVVVGQRAGNEKRAEAAFVVNMSLDFRPEGSLEVVLCLVWFDLLVAV